jgi:hypothetical protein
MTDKRLRSVIKEEPDSSGDQQQQQQVAPERVRQRRRDEEGGAGDSERETQLPKMNVEFQAFAFQAMEQKRAMDEELLRLKVEIAQLREESKLQQALIRRLQSDSSGRPAVAAAWPRSGISFPYLARYSAGEPQTNFILP